MDLVSPPVVWKAVTSDNLQTAVFLLGLVFVVFFWTVFTRI